MLVACMFVTVHRLVWRAQGKLEGGEYHNDPDLFAADVRQVWTNAKTFNQPGSPIYLAADRLSKIFEKRFSKLNRCVRERCAVSDFCVCKRCLNISFPFPQVGFAYRALFAFVCARV
jgi:hypothetical protein